MRLKLRIPNTFTLIFLLIIIAAIATWFLPAGQFDTKLDAATGKNLVVAGTYHHVASHPQGLTSILMAFVKGLIDSSEVVSFVLIVGGSYGVILKTGAIENGLMSAISKLGNTAKLLIPILMFLFSVGGTTTGMWEETLPFYLIMIPLMITLGYDSLVGISVILLGAATGTMASTVNPFATGIASGIAGISIKDGFNYRLILYFLSVVISILYVMWYAARIKKDPTKSIVYELQEDHNKHFKKSQEVNSNNIFSLQQKLILVLFVLMICFMIYSIIKLGWFMQEITMLFLGVAIISAWLTRMPEDTFWNAFIDGAKDLLSAALVIGLARGIVLVAQEGLIMDTILNDMANYLAGLSSGVFIVLNEIVQICIAFLVPSSSGHAALTMPIMAPLADLLHIKKEIIVTSYQTASGLVNMVTPTSGVLIAALAIGRTTWGQWVRFMAPLLGVQFILVIIILLISLY